MQIKSNILIVDDDESMRESLSSLLEKEDYDITAVDRGDSAIEVMKDCDFDVAIVDLKVRGLDGIRVLEWVRNNSPDTEVILTTSHATVASAVSAMKKGAYDYIVKPFSPEEIVATVSKVADHHALIRENIYLRGQLHSQHSFDNIIGKSHRMQDIFSLIKNIAKTNVTVLICGESGTGKEIIAKAIHHASSRRDQAFVATSCGAIPDTLLETELFGYEKGAFTGAETRKKGRFEVAHGGTLFLDEISEMSLKSQVDLLRVLQEREFRRVGGTELVKVDVRIIAATNKDLEQEIEEGNFRDDLYYRINVVSIHIPPLRERKEDIPLLAKHFLNKFNAEHGKDVKDLSHEAISAMLKYDWPGNVRELEGVIEQAVILTENGRIEVSDLPPKMLFTNKNSPKLDCGNNSTFREEIEKLEKEMVIKALRRTNFTKKDAAILLGISQRSLSYYVKKFNVSRKEMVRWGHGG